MVTIWLVVLGIYGVGHFLNGIILIGARENSLSIEAIFGCEYNVSTSIIVWLFGTAAVDRIIVNRCSIECRWRCR